MSSALPFFRFSRRSRRLHGLDLAIVGSLFSVLLTIGAQAQSVKTVPWEQAEVEISFDELGMAGPLPVSHATSISPAYGVLEDNKGDSFRYLPTSEFWQAGVDNFQIEVDGQLRDVFLIANLREDDFAGEALPGCSIGELWQLEGDLTGFTVVAAEGLNGDCGMQLQLGVPAIALRPRPQALTGPGGGNTSITLDPGIGGFPGFPNVPDGLTVALAAGILQNGSVAFELVLIDDATLVARAYDAEGVYTESAPIVLELGPQELELDWWFASAPGASDGGLLLSRNGLLEAEINGVDNFGLLEQPWNWHFGVLGESVGASGGFILYDPEVWTSPRQPIFEPIFADSAGTLSLERWSSLVNGQYISVVTDPLKQDPQFSLMFDGTRRQVAMRDGSPQAERHYRARFSVNVEDLAPGALGWTLLKAHNAERSNVLFRVQTRYSAALGAYQLRIVAGTGTGQVGSTWATLEPGVTAFDVAMQWWAQEGADGGGMRLWSDAELVAELQDVQNAGMRVEEVSIGGMGVLEDWTGSLTIDDVFTWR